jgi:hypothetical protein
MMRFESSLRSVNVLTVMVAAIWSPMMTVLAEELSWARVIVNVSVEIAVTRTISAFAVVGCVLAGQIVALNGVAGNFVPSAAVTTRLVPDDAGDGAVATRDEAKFLWASANFYAASGVRAIVSEADGIVNVSPIATVFDAVSALEPRNVPAELAVQNETCEYVSAVLTLSQTTSAFVAFAPAEEDANVACCRVVLPAAFDVPAAPGSPVWSFTQTAALPA